MTAAWSARPVIIEAAINGATPRSRQPHVPRSADEIVADALACLDVGASIIHHHLGDIQVDGGGDRGGEGASNGRRVAEAYLSVWRRVLQVRPEALLYPTFNFHDDASHDHAHFEPLAASGLSRLALSDPGSVNLARWRDGVPAGGFVYTNSADTVADQLDTCRRLGLGPALAIYEPGFLRTAVAWHRAGRLPAGSMVKLYLCHDRGAFGGTPFGLPPTRTALDAYLEVLDGTGLAWAVSVVGGDVTREDVAGYALDHGGHLHLGLEFYDGDRHPTNAELVAEAVELCVAHGRPVASSADTIAMLGLPPR